MSERLRFVGAMDRVLYLRTLSELEGVPAAELATLAAHGRERSFRPGELLLEEGELPSSFFIVARGAVEISSEGQVLGFSRERQPVGLVALLARDDNGIRARAVDEVLCLEFSAELLRDSLEERFPIVQNLLRNSARQLLELFGRGDPSLMIPVAQEAVSCPARPLDLVERIVLLRKAAPFREAGLDALAELARQLDEKRWDPGSMVMSAGEMGHRIEILVCGQVECHEQTRDLDYIVGAGFALGVMEAYAGVRRDYHAVALDHVVSLSLSAGMMIDLMEDHPDIADSIIAIMARTTLRYARALAVQGSDVHGDETSS